VTLNGFTHFFPGDVSVMVVAPDGTSVKLMADVRGDDNPVFNLVFTFSDDALDYLPDFDPLGNGVYKPSDYRPGSLLPPPAPQTSYSTNLSAFRGLDPNGNWLLYVYDDALGDGGSIASWILNVEWSPPLSLAHPRITATGAFQADVLGQSGTTYIIERSTNLSTWIPFLTNVFPANLDGFIDLEAKQFPRRYYRVVQ
jgi:hypothetical protein